MVKTTPLKPRRQKSFLLQGTKEVNWPYPRIRYLKRVNVFLLPERGSSFAIFNKIISYL
jgi:hypothetical protein